MRNRNQSSKLKSLINPQARLKNSDEEEGRYDGSKTWPWWRGSYPVCGAAVFLLSGVEGLTRCRKARSWYRNRRGRRRPEPYRNILPGRRSIWFRDALDNAFFLSAHG